MICTRDTLPVSNLKHLWERHWYFKSFVWSEWNHIFFSRNEDLKHRFVLVTLRDFFVKKNEHELNWDGNQCSYYSISIHQMTIWRTEIIKNFENVPLILMIAPQITTLMWNSKWMVHKLKKTQWTNGLNRNK